jgi:hypothetical protein
MTDTKTANPVFCEGDEVVLAEGSYTGTPGVFLHLRQDPNWADITERDGSVRRHPIAWLAQSRTVTERNRTAA